MAKKEKNLAENLNFNKDVLYAQFQKQYENFEKEINTKINVYQEDLAKSRQNHALSIISILATIVGVFISFGFSTTFIKETSKILFEKGIITGVGALFLFLFLGTFVFFIFLQMLYYFINSLVNKNNFFGSNFLKFLFVLFFQIIVVYFLMYYVKNADVILLKMAEKSSETVSSVFYNIVMNIALIFLVLTFLVNVIIQITPFFKNIFLKNR